MLDTDIASYAIRARSPALDRRMRAARAGSLCISVITRGELLLGVALKPDASALARAVDEFINAVPSLAWDDSAASAYARVASQLQSVGHPIGTMDTLIAGHALAMKAILVTHNTRHFSRITGLHVEDWTKDLPPRRQ